MCEAERAEQTYFPDLGPVPALNSFAQRMEDLSDGYARKHWARLNGHGYPVVGPLNDRGRAWWARNAELGALLYARIGLAHGRREP